MAHVPHPNVAASTYLYSLRPVMTVADDFLIAAYDLQLPVRPELISLFDKYFQELKFWNRRVNLTRIHGEREVYINHFLDSLIPERFIPQKATVLDIGSGGGFPGIPIKIVRPDLEVTLVDSVFKKVAFQRHLIRILGLDHIQAVHQRAGTAGEGLGVFTVCISRAFGSLLELFAAALPVLDRGGQIIALKGPRWMAELEEARGEIEKLGIIMKAHESVILPHTRVHRTVLVFSLRT